ncbi:MAG TPA: hypothetical protein VFN35_34530, partial [Ktedonobacteraceae bacterium]|nr:hypothetical protein [Ktedonobacteraceae bacterium]
MAVSVGFQEIDLCVDGTIHNCTSASATCDIISTPAVVRGTNKDNRLAIEVLDAGNQQVSLIIFVNGQYVTSQTIDAHKDLSKPAIYLKSPGLGNNVQFTNLKVWEINPA